MKLSILITYNEFLDLLYGPLSSLKMSNKNNSRILIYLICVTGLWAYARADRRTNCVVKDPTSAIKIN